jgi:F-type H+-transporting ATPase subunit b
VLINWFTFSAQILNFLLLLFLLKRFLYKPILRAMQEREKKIAVRMTEAETARQEALTLSGELEKEKESLRKTKERIVAEAGAEVRLWKETALERARREIDTLRRAWMDSVEAEKERFLKQLQTQVARQVIGISGKVLKDLANGDLETRVIDVFLEKVKVDWSEIEGKSFEAPNRVLVRSGFELKEDMKNRVRRGLEDLLPGKEAIDFTLDLEIGFGVQLVTGDWKVEWNLAWYMQALESELLKFLAPAARREE